MVLMKQLRMYTIPCIGVDKATMLHPGNPVICPAML